MQDITDVLENDYKPWLEGVPDAIGDLCHATTDAGNPVRVWRAYEGVPQDHRYWCHGHATLSYYLNGYSIFSCDDMEQVLADEWVQVTKKPTVGDLIVFRAQQDGANYVRGAILHTARVEIAVHSLGSRTIFSVSTKNGANRMRRRESPANVLGAYRHTYWYLENRGTTCCCFASVTRTNKQYYRRLNGQNAVTIDSILNQL